jgi:hypothetical protein
MAIRRSGLRGIGLVRFVGIMNRGGIVPAVGIMCVMDVRDDIF